MMPGGQTAPSVGHLFRLLGITAFGADPAWHHEVSENRSVII
jgi:hypothetical protein